MRDESMMSESSLEAPTALLQELERQQVAGKHKQQRSVKDCLRSKALPCPQVRTLLLSLSSASATCDRADNSSNSSDEASESSLLNAEQVLCSYDALMGDYLERIQNSQPTSGSPNIRKHPSPPSSTWDCISSCTTVIRFVQLLLELMTTEISSDKNRHHSSLLLQQLDPARMRQMVLALLKGLMTASSVGARTLSRLDNNSTLSSSSFSCSSTNPRECLYTADIAGNNDDDSCAAVERHHHKVALFVTGSLLRLNHYVRSHPFLLSPLWKGLCDMALSVRESMPQEMVSNAVKALLDHIHDGIHPTLSACEQFVACAAQQQVAVSQHPDSSSSSSNALQGMNVNEQTFSSKILGFLLVRLGTFLSFGLDAAETGTAYTTNINAALPMQVVQVLFLLCGLGDVMDHHFAALPVSTTTTISKAFQQVSAKAEKCFTCWFWATNTSTLIISTTSAANSENESTTESTTRMAAAAASQHLCHLVQSPSMASIDLGVNNNGPVTNLAYTNGRTRLFVKALEDADLRQSLWTHISLDDVQALLGICQQLLFRSLPLSMNLILSSSSAGICTQKQDRSGSSILVSRCISAVVATILWCETRSACVATNLRPGRVSLHCLLAKWLSTCQPNGDNSIHPLSRELVLSVLHLYAVGHCRLGGVHDVLPFLSLLTKLLVDVRTSLLFRKMIAACLARMLQSNEKRLYRKLGSLLTEQGHALQQQLLAAVRSKKRKRRHKAEPMLDALDLAVISSLLAKVGGALSTSIVVPNSGTLLSKSCLNLALFQNLVLSDSLECIDTAIKMFRERWSSLSQQNKADSSCGRLQLVSLLGIAAMRQVHAFCSNREERNLSDASVCDVCQLMELCTNESMFSSLRKCDVTIRLPMEVIRAMSAVGSALNLSTPPIHLQSLANSFKRLLSHSDWSIRSYTMSSLVRFASTIPAAHKSILPTCVPRNMQSLLQQRLKDSHASSNESILLLRHYCTRELILKSLPPENHEVRSAVLVVPKSITIAQGSLVMTMPTQEGRSALLVFPPGQQSRNDIFFMLGIEPNNGEVDEEHTPEILQLHCAVTTTEGTCKFVLK